MVQTFPRRLIAYVLIPVPAERRAEVVLELSTDSRISRDFVLLTLLSCVVATLGLILNGAAVIIGAMLIAAFVPVILATAMAVVRADLKMAIRALATFTAGTVLAIAVSALLASLSTSAVVTLDELPAEVLARTRPTFLDLAIALAGGAAAAYTLTHPRLSAALPGVAIATALMPPICVVGVGLSQGRGDVAIGALYLLLANFVAIVFGSLLTFAGLGFGPPVRQRNFKGLLMSAALSVAFILPVTAPLVAFLARLDGDFREARLVEGVVRSHLVEISDSSLVSIDRQDSGERLNLVIQLRSPRALSQEEALGIQRDIAEAVQRPTGVRFLVIPVTQLTTITAPPARPGATSTVRPGTVR